MTTDSKPEEMKLCEDAIIDLFADLIIDRYLLDGKNGQLQFLEKQPTMNIEPNNHYGTKRA